MRSVRRFAPLAAAIIAAGCGDAMAPSTEMASSAASRSSTTQPVVDPSGARQELVVELDHVTRIACAGEDVRFSGPVVYRVHRTTTPSGNSTLHVTVPVSAAPAPFRGVGQRSGRVWTLERGTSGQTIAWKKSGRRVVNLTRNETYVGANREVMNLKHDMHVVIEDGLMTGVNDQGWSCR